MTAALRAVRARLAAARASETGIAAVEFALIGPLLLLMLTAVIDVAILIFILVSLESAALEAARYGATGQDADGSTRDEQIRRIVSDGLFGLVDPADLAVRSRVYEGFAQIASAEHLFDLDDDGELDAGETFDDVNGNGVWDGDPGAPGAGAGEDVVLYRVETLWRPITPLAGPLIGDVPISAVVPIRNEPF